MWPNRTFENIEWKVMGDGYTNVGVGSFGGTLIASFTLLAKMPKASIIVHEVLQGKALETFLNALH